MIRLFSRFDLFIFNYQKFLIPLLLMSLRISNFINEFKNHVVRKIFNFYLDFFYSIKVGISKFLCRINVILFLIIFLINFLSLNSYVFSLTSQLSVCLIWRLLFWCSFNIIIIFRNFSYFISHFVPSGSPIYLVIFLFMIEIVRNFIRFITLIVRLTANILAGHLLVILLSNIVMKIFLVMPIFLLLNVVEIFVSLIQSYIFCTIVCLYYSEIN